MKVQRLFARARCGLNSEGLPAKIACSVLIVLFSFLLDGCARQSAHEPVTLTFLDEWPNKTFSEARQQELLEFTRETGIRVSLLPSPDSARQKLVLWRESLGAGATGPDVYAFDVIRPGAPAAYFPHLTPYI